MGMIVGMSVIMLMFMLINIVNEEVLTRLMLVKLSRLRH